MLIEKNGPSSDPAAAVARAVAEAAKAEAERVRAAAATAIHDVFETAHKVAALFTPPTACPPPPAPGLSPAELEAAQQTIALASDGRYAQPVADWLEAHPDPADRDQFMDTMFRFGPVAGEILDRTSLITEDDRIGLARALDHAYRSGAVTGDELRASVERFGYGAGPVESHVGLAGVVGETGNPDLIATYAGREIEILSGEQGEGARALGVATALGRLFPADLQRFLAANREGVRATISSLNADPDARYSPAHAGLLGAAAAIVPPTAESLALFDDSIAQIGENALTREAAAAFFERHADAVIGSLQADSAKLTVDGQGKLSNFFARTLFTDPPYEGQERFRAFLMSRLSSLGRSLDAHALDNPPPLAAQREAQVLGSLVGTIEGGFQIAVDELDQRNEAVEKMTDFLFRGASLLPDAPVPGFGILKDLTVDQIKDWVTESLKEKPRDASEALPFHALIGDRIDSVALSTIYDSARSEAFTNRGLGLVR